MQDRFLYIPAMHGFHVRQRFLQWKSKDCCGRRYRHFLYILVDKKAEFLAKVYNFEKNPEEWKYEGDKPAIVDFYADWCGPCKMVAPILDELAKEYDGQIVIYKVDTEKEQELAGAFGIRSIPSILFIPMEGKPEMAQGAMPKASFKKAIDEFLLKK